MKVNNSLIPPPAVTNKPNAEDKLEQAFLEEMLKYVMPEASGEFTGGIGEEQFQTFLNQMRAETLASQLDLGLGITQNLRK